MKIIIPTFERIEWMPPTITLVRKLVSMGHEVTYITIYPDAYFAGEEGIRNVALCKKTICLQEKVPYIRGLSSILWRADNAIKKIISRRVKKAVDKEMQQGDLLWVVNEMTVMLAGSWWLRSRDFLFTVYELHENRFYARNIRRAAQMAGRVIVPEYNRAHIMKARYKLKKLPIVLPNKSDIPTQFTLSERETAALETIQELKRRGKTVIAYMGGIGSERPLEPLLDAIQGNDKYILAVIGRESEYLHKLQKAYENIIYLGGFRTPNHLAVAKEADIGLIVYVSLNDAQAMNALYCAPNKIYEYSGLGLPMLANDIPGLRYEIEFNRIGTVVDYEDPASILSGLQELTDRRADYAENEKVYFAKMDVDRIIADIVGDCAR